ncbi:hypothetical protein L506_2514 [Bordetella bronchiseptica GA96-01]|nr:hypothetical protein L572_2539 [Bordetella bronchiseptica 345]KDC39164.1 hypothetical protein L506_2514 [Bordetella bronchiseptica GA96-01]
MPVPTWGLISATACACPRRDRHTAVRHRRDGQDGIRPRRDRHQKFPLLRNSSALE